MQVISIHTNNKNARDKEKEEEERGIETGRERGKRTFVARSWEAKL